MRNALFVTGCALLSAGAGCSWTSFDDLEKGCRRERLELCREFNRRTPGADFRVGLDASQDGWRTLICDNHRSQEAAIHISLRWGYIHGG